jgi:hypothetical protein
MDALYGNYFHTQGQGIEMFLYMNNRNMYNHAVAMRTQFEKVVGSPQFKTMLKRTFVDGDQFKIGLFEMFNDYVVLNYAKTLLENMDADMNQRGGGGRGHGRAPAPQQSRRDRSHKVTTPQTFTRRAILRAAVPAPARRRRELFARANTEGFLQGLSKLISKNSQTHGVSMEQIEKSHAFLFNLISNRCRKGFLEAYALNNETVRERAVAQVETVCKTLIPQVAKANKIVGITNEVVTKMVDDIKTSAEKTHTSGMTVAKKNQKIQWQKNSKSLSSKDLSMESTLTNWYSSVVSSLLENGPVQFVLNFFSKKKSNASTRMLRYINKNTGFVHGEKGIKLLYSRNASRKAQRFERRQKQFAKVSEAYKKGKQNWSIFFLALLIGNGVAQSTVARQALGLQSETVPFGKGPSTSRALEYKMPFYDLPVVEKFERAINNPQIDAKDIFAETQIRNLTSIASYGVLNGTVSPAMTNQTVSLITTAQANRTTPIGCLVARTLPLSPSLGGGKNATYGAITNMTLAMRYPTETAVNTTLEMFNNGELTVNVARQRPLDFSSETYLCPFSKPIKFESLPNRHMKLGTNVTSPLLTIIAASAVDTSYVEFTVGVNLETDGTITFNKTLATSYKKNMTCLPGTGAATQTSCVPSAVVNKNTVAILHPHAFIGDVFAEPPSREDALSLVYQTFVLRVPYSMIPAPEGIYFQSLQWSEGMRKVVNDDNINTAFLANIVMTSALDKVPTSSFLNHYNCTYTTSGIIEKHNLTTVKIQTSGINENIPLGITTQFISWADFKNSGAEFNTDLFPLFRQLPTYEKLGGKEGKMTSKQAPRPGWNGTELLNEIHQKQLQNPSLKSTERTTHLLENNPHIFQLKEIFKAPFEKRYPAFKKIITSITLGDPFDTVLSMLIHIAKGAGIPTPTPTPVSSATPASTEKPSVPPLVPSTTATGTVTGTPTSSKAATASHTASTTVTGTPTSSKSATRSSTTGTVTGTPTGTATATPTSSKAATASHTASTSSKAATSSATGTVTGTPTSSKSATRSSATGTVTGTPTGTATATPTASTTVTATPSNTAASVAPTMDGATWIKTCPFTPFADLEHSDITPERVDHLIECTRSSFLTISLDYIDEVINVLQKYKHPNGEFVYSKQLRILDNMKAQRLEEADSQGLCPRGDVWTNRSISRELGRKSISKARAKDLVRCALSSTDRQYVEGIYKVLSRNNYKEEAYQVLVKLESFSNTTVISSVAPSKQATATVASSVAPSVASTSTEKPTAKPAESWSEYKPRGYLSWLGSQITGIAAGILTAPISSGMGGPSGYKAGTTIGKYITYPLEYVETGITNFIGLTEAPKNK